jgi:hypothetical protein
MSCQTSSTAVIEAASDNANAKPNPITSCAMTFTIIPLKSTAFTKQGWGHAALTQRTMQPRSTGLCLRRAFGSGSARARSHVAVRVSGGL